MTGRRSGVVLMAWLLAMICLARPSAAQRTPSGAHVGGDDLTYLSVNALVGGLTSGLFSRARGGPFLEPFARGLLGGSISYAGKRLGGTSVPGAGLVGRQVAATGSSVVRNAAFGAAVLDTLFLPLGPGRLHVPLHSRGPPAYRVDLEEVTWLLYALTRDHLTLDAGESISSGTFVFTGDERLRGEDDNALGRAAPSVISIRRTDDARDARTLAHERVHIAQLDQLKLLFGLPLEGWFRRAWGLEPGGWHDHVEMGIGHYPLLWLLTEPWTGHADRPLEREAEFIEAQRRGG